MTATGQTTVNNKQPFGPQRLRIWYITLWGLGRKNDDGKNQTVELSFQGSVEQQTFPEASCFCHIHRCFFTLRWCIPSKNWWREYGNPNNLIKTMSFVSPENGWFCPQVTVSVSPKARCGTPQICSSGSTSHDLQAVVLQMRSAFRTGKGSDMSSAQLIYSIIILMIHDQLWFTINYDSWSTMINRIMPLNFVLTLFWSLNVTAVRLKATMKGAVAYTTSDVRQ